MSDAFFDSPTPPEKPKPTDETSSGTGPTLEEQDELEPDEPDKLDAPAAEGEVTEDELEAWKDALRDHFEAWLEGVDEVPVAEDDEEPDQPDLYAFYETLAAFNTEYRKANRRTAEAFGQWGETLGRFDQQLGRLREHLSATATPKPAGEGRLPRPYCLAMLEILDRMDRLAKAFQTPPKSSWWGGDAPWKQAWENQRQAFGIVLSHFDSILKKEGITVMEVVGKPFDPTVMQAVATENDPSRPHQSVVEATASGYMQNGEMLRPAQVKITLNPNK